MCTSSTEAPEIVFNCVFVASELLQRSRHLLRFLSCNSQSWNGQTFPLFCISRNLVIWAIKLKATENLQSFHANVMEEQCDFVFGHLGCEFCNHHVVTPHLFPYFPVLRKISRHFQGSRRTIPGIRLENSCCVICWACASGAGSGSGMVPLVKLLSVSSCLRSRSSWQAVLSFFTNMALQRCFRFYSAATCFNSSAFNYKDQRESHKDHTRVTRYHEVLGITH